MNTSQQIAKHLREVHFGGNWTASNLKEQLADVTWLQATTQVYSINSIATLVYHIHYYVHAVLKVLQGEKLDASDKISFNHPPINNATDWELFLEKVWTEAESFAILIEKIPENKLQEIFTDEKYGNYFRNLIGIIEHSHYHLGQIVIIKKIIAQQAKKD